MISGVASHPHDLEYVRTWCQQRVDESQERMGANSSMRNETNSSSMTFNLCNMMVGSTAELRPFEQIPSQQKVKIGERHGIFELRQRNFELKCVDLFLKTLL